MQRTVVVRLGAFSLESLAGAATGDAATLASSLAQALRYYLADRDSGRSGWLYPGFRNGEGTIDDGVEVSLDIDEETWADFMQEAGRQAVTPEHLLEHAAFYFAVDRETGRLARRIVEDLDRNGS